MTANQEIKIEDKDIYKTLKIHTRDIQVNKDKIDSVKEEMTEEFNIRVKKFLSYSLDNRIDATREQIKRELKEELKRE